MSKGVTDAGAFNDLLGRMASAASAAFEQTPLQHAQRPPEFIRQNPETLESIPSLPAVFVWLTGLTADVENLGGGAGATQRVTYGLIGNYRYTVGQIDTEQQEEELLRDAWWLMDALHNNLDLSGFGLIHGAPHLEAVDMSPGFEVVDGKFRDVSQIDLTFVYPITFMHKVT